MEGMRVKKYGEQRGAMTSHTRCSHKGYRTYVYKAYTVQRQAIHGVVTRLAGCSFKVHTVQRQAIHDATTRFAACDYMAYTAQ